jgi:ketosteroid isomerase-like protein
MSSNADVVNGAYEDFSRGNISAVIAVVDENASWDVSPAVPQGGSFRGKDGVGRASGTLNDGRSASYGFAHVFTMDDGRIVRFREYVDPDEALRG